MKGFICDNCGDIVTMARKDYIKYCACKKYVAKYLMDGITLIINGTPIIFGIDNNTFVTAEMRAIKARVELNARIDLFFTGWIPNFPGEVVFVRSKRQVLKFPDHIVINKTSTNPRSV